MECDSAKDRSPCMNVTIVEWPVRQNEIQLGSHTVDQTSLTLGRRSVEQGSEQLGHTINDQKSEGWLGASLRRGPQTRRWWINVGSTYNLERCTKIFQDVMSGLRIETW